VPLFCDPGHRDAEFIVEVDAMCRHEPRCPSADAPDQALAHVVVSHPEQGWSLLCNGVVLFDDLGQLLPDGQAVPSSIPLLHPAA
jgi:hypothetical protein